MRPLESNVLAEWGGGGEELWIIVQDKQKLPKAQSVSPTSGQLLTRFGDHQAALPLEAVHVNAQASGDVATVEFSQRYRNPYETPIEAIYVFPLPANAAVNEFVMIIGERRIRGIVRERMEAEHLYGQAKAQGYTASLLTQERPNVFTQSVANIQPGKDIEVSIKYLQTLAYVDGWHELAIPLVIGPRFTPANWGAVPASMNSAQIPRDHRPFELPSVNTSAHFPTTASIHLEVQGPLEEHECRSHQLEAEPSGRNRHRFHLSEGKEVPNRDFVFRYRVATDEIRSHFQTYKAQDAEDGYFRMTLYPPMNLVPTYAVPLEMVFVLDCSGSMSGRPLAQAKAAVAYALSHLQPEDTFQIVTFSMTASQFGPSPVPATRSQIQKGLRYVQSLQSEGGTFMIEGIKAALRFPHDPQRLRFVCFLTDGFIGNESEILTEVAQRLGETRIFSYGVGSAPNRYLMDALARLGRGAVAYLGPREDGEKVMDRFLQRVRHPALTDLRMDWAGLQVSEVYPKRIEDLFIGRSVSVVGRYKGQGKRQIRITGRIGGQSVEQDVEIDLDPPLGGQAALDTLWARGKVGYLMDRMLRAPGVKLENSIRRVALDYNLISPYTAFLAMDALKPSPSHRVQTIQIPVPPPEDMTADESDQ